jgi:hypothetical protein
MKFIRWIVFYVFLAIEFHASCIITLDNCRLFGQTAHDNPNNLYVASLSVGSGECHVVRKGDSSILVDAGFRCTWLTAAECVAFIKAMLSHTQPAVHVWPDAEAVDEIQIHPIKTFLSHSHSDHTNLIMLLVDDEVIQKDASGKVKTIFFGGGKSGYLEGIKALTGNSIPEGDHDFDESSIKCIQVGKAIVTCKSEVNGHGAIMSLNFSNRIFAFLGDMNGHPMSVQPDTGACITLQQQTAIAEVLSNADIITAPHHGSLTDNIPFIYNYLADSNRKKPRVFIVSAAPCSTGSATYPRIKRAILPLIQSASGTPATMVPATNKEVFNHFLTCDIEPHDPTVRAGITSPLFSTYDAPHGFVWTRIEPNGCISIYNGIDFQEVLPALPQQ